MNEQNEQNGQNKQNDQATNQGAYHIDRAKWARLSIFEQMGNVGSEVGRALAAKRRGDDKSAQAALVRGLDLLDATAEVWEAKHSPRVREILIARQQFVQAIEGPDDDPKLEAYFMWFAFVARRDR